MKSTLHFNSLRGVSFIEGQTPVGFSLNFLSPLLFGLDLFGEVANLG